ncbi:hypothetical protein J4440_02780 [Candidatus Woesearchaeota archaeon]|nr:hypothetical protein [Candidatus Woesearchaeota archaeon]
MDYISKRIDKIENLVRSILEIISLINQHNTEEINKKTLSIQSNINEVYIDYKKLISTIQKIRPTINAYQNKIVRTFLERVYEYNKMLDKLQIDIDNIQEICKRDSKFITLLEKCKNLKQVVKEIRELTTECSNIKEIKSRGDLDEYDNMALMLSHDKFQMVLYNRNNFYKEVEDFDKLLHMMYEGPEELREVIRKEYKIKQEQVKGKYLFSDGQSFFWGEEDLGYLGYRMAETVIIGYCEFKCKHDKETYLGAWEIFRIAAKKGYGPLMFEIACSFVSQDKSPVIIDRDEVSKGARKILEYFDTNRTDMIKYPGSLIKYPELIGFTREEVIELFGSGPLGSVFDGYGYPKGIPREKLIKLCKKDLHKHFGGSKSYLEREGNKNTNQVLGGLASLDKAYYYDRQKEFMISLIQKGKQDIRYKSDLLKYGHAFFKSFRPNQQGS